MKKKLFFVLLSSLIVLQGCAPPAMKGLSNNHPNFKSYAQITSERFAKAIHPKNSGCIAFSFQNGSAAIPVHWSQYLDGARHDVGSNIRFELFLAEHSAEGNPIDRYKAVMHFLTQSFGNVPLQGYWTKDLNDLLPPYKNRCALRPILVLGDDGKIVSRLSTPPLTNSQAERNAELTVLAVINPR